MLKKVVRVLLLLVAGAAAVQSGWLGGHSVLLPGFLLLLAATALGAPIFALLGGFALFASLTRGNPPVVLPMMAYQELTTSTGIAAIPLFTLAGFLLAEGRSSERLLRIFRAWVGWAPGGTAVAAATLSRSPGRLCGLPVKGHIPGAGTPPIATIGRGSLRVARGGFASCGAACPFGKE